MLSQHLLSLVVSLPALGAVVLLFVPSSRVDWIRWIGLTASLATFLLSILLWVRFDQSTAEFQFLEHFAWLPSGSLGFTLGIDGISLFLVILTTFLIPLCLLASWDSVQTNVREYFIAFLGMESLLLVVFSVLDLLLFYVFFEAVLIPMFLIVGVWGGRARKVRAAYMFFLYTLLGSVLMLLAVMYVYLNSGTTDYMILLNTPIDSEVQKFLWLAFFASFAVKVPMLPFHIWLPEAHVEAPTAGSVILAGVLLKLGGYGLLRFSLPLFPDATVFFTPLVFTMAAVAIVYSSLTAMRQTDLKRIIAYSSVAHMNLGLIGLFSLTHQGVEGSVLLMIGHGVVSSALFLCVGIVYDRHHTRMVKYYGGLAHMMPLFVTSFMVFTMANIGLPGTSNFVGEFMCIVGAFQANTWIGAWAATGMVLGGGYSLWLYNRVAFGNLKIQHMDQFSDMGRREVAVFVPLLILTILFGVYPECLLDPIHTSCGNVVANLHARIG